MLGKKAMQAKLLYDFSLEKVVPQDDFYRKLQAAVDLSWARSWAASRYSTIGRPSLDPEVFVKIELAGYLEGIVSERELMRQINDRLSLRRYLGYDIDEAVPEHSTLSKTRTLLGKELCQAILDHSVRLCQAAGMVGDVHQSVDKTIVKANASLENMEPRVVQQSAQQFIERVFVENDEPADETRESDGLRRVTSIEEQPGYPSRLPVRLADPEAAPVRQAPGMQAGLAEEGKGKKRIEAKGKGKRKKEKKGELSNATHVSRSDPEAELVSRPHLPLILAHAAEFYVDSGQGVIVHAEATRANLPEQATVMKGVQRQRQELGLKVPSVSADKGYGKGPLYKDLAEAGVVGYIPHAKVGNWTKEQKLYGVKDFVYVPERNVYLCPAGKELAYRHLDVAWPQVKHVWRAQRQDCKGCEQRGRCTTAKIGRSLCLSIYEPYYEEMDRRLGEQGARLAAIARRTGPEREYADGKEKYGLRRAKYRGTVKFGYQVKMTAAAMNLKKYVRWIWRKGWGAGMKRAERPGTTSLFLCFKTISPWLAPSPVLS